jgi:acetyltransferase-like isoleucine patch superfamily enzyme
VQRRLYQRRGYRIAGDVEFAPGVVIDGEDVEIGAGASFGLGAVIRGKNISIGRRVHIGSFCVFEGRDISIGDDSVVREQVYVGGPLLPDSLLEIGKRVKIFQTCFLNPSRPLRIGDDTGLGGRSSVFTHGSWQSQLDGYPVAFEPVTIGRNVWLPWHVFILPGVEIGDNATIGAGSIVNRSIPAGALAAGVPAKVLRAAENWPSPIGPDEQWALARGIVTTMAGYLEDQGVHVERDVGERRVSLELVYGGSLSRIVLARGAVDAFGDADVVMQLDGTPAGAVGQAWFALLEKRKGGPESDVSCEVEGFLSRYGLRFQPHEEP